MTRDLDAQDGMVIQVGDVKMTIYQMTGHTPGSIGDDRAGEVAGKALIRS